MKTITLLAIFLTLSGCASARLKNSTLSQAETLTDLQYRIVLNNVALQRLIPGALPWHIKITQGIIQISDTVSPGIGGTLESPTSSGTASLGAERNWQHSWTVVPEVSGTNLTKVMKVYGAAANYDWIKDGPGPKGAFRGRYQDREVYVERTNAWRLTGLTLAVLYAAPVADEERAFILPNFPGR